MCSVKRPRILALPSASDRFGKLNCISTVHLKRFCVWPLQLRFEPCPALLFASPGAPHLLLVACKFVQAATSLAVWIRARTAT